MIHRWSLARFKSIAQQEDLELRPLTVLTGANSSGKSTLLQSMLLVEQTLASKVERRHLLLNGDTVRLGSLTDIVSHGSDSSTISIGWDQVVDERLIRSSRATQRGMSFWGPWFFGGRRTPVRVTAKLIFGNAEFPIEGATERHYVELRCATFSIDGLQVDDEEQHPAQRTTIQVRQRSPSEAEKLLAESDIGSVDKENAALALRYEVEIDGKPTLAKSQWLPSPLSELEMRDAQLVGAAIDHFLPVGVMLRFASLERRVRQATNELARTASEPTDVVLKEWSESDDPVKRQVSNYFIGKPDSPLLSKILKPGGRASQRMTKEELSALAGRVRSHFEGTPLAQQTEFAMLPVESFFEMGNSITTEFAFLQYLGPLRDEPRAVHELGSGSDPRDVGKKGEYTASVLHLYGSTVVDFISPNNPSGTIEQCSLNKAVHAWLQHFGIAKDVTIDDEGKLGLRLFIQPGGLSRKLDLTNVGVGVSQVLPIVVMALISAPGSVLLFEQPELHLHPCVQSQLADFLIAVMSTGRQCIVETHSEYLVNRLRRRVAEASSDPGIADKILLYFVERHHGSSDFRKVTINEYGAIPDWPSGFFDQGPAESECILQAASKKRAQKRGA